MESYEDVFYNVDLLAGILKYLDFKDQLRLAQVNDRLREAYRLCTGNVNYSFNCIFHYSVFGLSTIIVAGEFGTNGKCLQDPKILADLLAVYADEALKDLMLWDLDEWLCLIILRKFHSRSLTIYKTKFTLAIAENLPADLQELNLIDSFPDTEEIVDVIARMTKLHKVQLTQITYPKCLQRMEQIEQIEQIERIEHMNLLLLNLLNLSKVKCLKFKNAIGINNLCLQAANNLKELDIKLENVQHFQRLPHQNLIVLHLSFQQPITEHLFSILSESCGNIETLTLYDIIFQNETIISLPSKLTELSFHSCKNLRHSCLRQILTEFKIIKFCSRNSFYLGAFYDFQISPHIQSLEIDFVAMTQFRLAFENNRQLKELIWKSDQRNDSNDISFNSTPNLQRLDITYISAVGGLRQLNSLRSLTLNGFDDQPKWSDIEELLKQPTLRELSMNYEYDISGVCDQPLQQLHTNITRLTISPTILTKWLKTWLELFSTNLKLTLVCWPIEVIEVALSHAKDLVEHENFPIQLKSIDVCCFTIDCKQLRRNWWDVSSEFEPIISKIYYDLKQKQIIWDNLKVAKRNRIVLSWKYEYDFEKHSNYNY